MDVKMQKKRQKSSKSKKKDVVEKEESVGIAEDDELHSLIHYAGDEETLVNHMFAAIQGTKLEAMMPAVLKAIPLHDLKLLCIHELRGISKKRIIAIIQGKVMSDSSGSSDEDEDVEMEIHLSASPAKQHGHASEQAAMHKSKRDKHSRHAKKAGDKPMDIVELEMRARLIETMLKNDPKHNGAANDSHETKIKSEPLSDRSRSRSYSGSRSYSSRSRSYSGSSSRSSYASDSDGKRKRKKRSSHHRSRRDRHGRRKRDHGSSSKKRSSSKDQSVTPDRNEDEAKKRQSKKTKISRKEFEDRMKKAKENRTYRKRKESDEEAKADQNDKREGSSRHKNRSRKTKEIKSEPVEKEPGEEESEKEEGEIDSNEEEGSYNSNRRSGSRSSFSSRSGSRSDRSDYSSRSRSNSKRRSKRRKDKKRSKRDARLPVDKSLILATLNNGDEASGKPDNDKTKPGIETVDSEEDFDSINGGITRSVKIEEGSHMVPRTDRTNVSFSFNKKTQPNLVQGTDLEFGMSFGRPSSYKPPQPSKDQIVISSDSEKEEHSEKSKLKKLGKVGEITATDNPSEIDENTNAVSPNKDLAPNISDQSDLKLCEATVMKDIFDDIDEEEENRHEVKKELLIKSEPSEVMDPMAMEVSAEYVNNQQVEIPLNASLSHTTSMSTADSYINESDIHVKREMLSPRNEEESISHAAEQWSLEDTNVMKCKASEKKKSHKSKKKSKTAVFMEENLAERTENGSGNSNIQDEPPEGGSSSYNVPQLTGNPLLNESAEDGACTDQDTDLNESALGDDKLSDTEPVLETNNIVDAEETITSSFENTGVSENMVITASAEQSSMEMKEKDNVNEPCDMDEEEEGGLVDLPEDEHFEIIEDDDDMVANKYEVGAIESMDQEMEESEVTNERTDFYRGVDALSFSKENSRASLEDEISRTENQVEKELDNASEDGEVEDDGGLVELQPEEAEELSSALDTSLPVRKQGNTEIIGEIEPSNEGLTTIENLAESGSSWNTRWLQSEKVQKVVSSSNFLSRVRNRKKKDKKEAKSGATVALVSSSVAAAAAATPTVAEEIPEVKAPESSAVPVIGSMEEYQKMLAEQESAAEQSISASSEPAAEKVAATEPKSEALREDQPSSGDSEDDELWSKMMGGD